MQLFLLSGIKICLFKTTDMKQSFRSLAFILFAGLLVASCGGGGDDRAASFSIGSTGSTASEGFAQINSRRVSAGIPPLVFSSEIALAAQNHSDYQRINGPFNEDGGPSPITHAETPGKPNFTGVEACPDRITAAGYVLDPQQGYGCGEVISALSDSSGVAAAEELIAAVYHRFIVLQPSFRDAGAGAAPSSDGRFVIFTQNFAVRGSFAGLGSGNFAVYPFHGQTMVPTSFSHSTEMPDPLPPSMFPEYIDKAVGYPVSVHADLDQRIDVTTFTLRQQTDSALMSARLLSVATDAETQSFSAGIVPFQQLSPNTAYVAEFSGTICVRNVETDQCVSAPVPVARTWTFTTS